MMNKKLTFKNGTKMQLFIGKDKKGFFGDLLLPLKDGSMYKINSRKEGFLFEISEHENETFDCVYENNSILYNGKVMAKYVNLFDKNKIAALYQKDDKAIIYIGNHILATLSNNELPQDLFKNRKFFRINIKDDNNWTIVRYANIHQHTENSLLDGIVKIDDLAEKIEYCSAITDHGNMYGFLDMQNAFKKQGKQAIIGCEFYIETLDGPRTIYQKNNEVGEIEVEELMFDNDKKQNPDGLNREHLIVLAKNNIGIKNLFYLSTNSYNHLYKKPHITYDDLKNHHEGLIVTSACIGGTLGQSIKQYLKMIAMQGHVYGLVQTFGEFFYNDDRFEKIKHMYADDESVDVYIYNHKLSRKFIDTMYGIFKDDFYLEIQKHDFAQEDMIMNEIRKIQKNEYPYIKMVAATDAHYLNKEDAYIHEVWLCNQTKKTMEDPTRMKFPGKNYYVHTSDEMVELFAGELELLDNTLEIADKIHYEEEPKEYHLPHYPLPEGFDNDEQYLRYMCKEGFKRLFKGTSKYSDPVYINRMKTEIDTIVSMGWPSYFLIVQDFIAWAKDANIKDHIERYFPKSQFDQGDIPEELVKNYEIYVGPGRGSAAGSLVSYCLGITDVDPIKYGLLFERFLNPDRISMPDIDTDIEDSGRQAVLSYVRYKYRPDHVTGIITFGTAAAKKAVRSVVKCLSLPVSLGDEISKMIPNKPGIKLQKAIDENNDLQNFIENNADVKKVIEIALKLEGLKTHASQHACGNLVCDKPVTNYMPQCLMLNKDTQKYEWVTQVEGPECEDLGCLKMDFLGLRTLGYVHETIESIKQNKGIEIIYDKIPLNDINVYKFLLNGNTASVFQLESAMFTSLVEQAYQDIEDKSSKIIDNATSEDEEKRKLQSLGDTCFNRLVDMNALVRPGPNAYIPNYCDNILNPDHITYDIPMEKDILDQTYGIILYQEQVMNIVKQFAGFSAGQADTIRKAMGKKKKEIIDEYKDYFIHGSKKLNIKGCVANGISESSATELWSKMEKFCEYAFNKSHAVSYSLHSIRTAWLAYYYPYEYMTGVLNSLIDKSDKIQQYLHVCNKKNLTVLPPSINESMLNFYTDGNSIRIGLSGIRNVGSSGKRVLEERKHGKFTSFSDFLYRMTKYQHIDKGMVEAFIFSGMFDEYQGSRKDKIMQMNKILDFISTIKVLNKDRYSIFDAYDYAYGKTLSERKALDIKIDDSKTDYSKLYKLLMEKKYSGMYISGHPMDDYMDIYKSKQIKEIAEILAVYEDEENNTSLIKKISRSTIEFAGIVQDFEIKHSKKGNQFMVFNLEDKSGTIKAVYFPDTNENYDSNLEFLSENEIIHIKGTIKKDDFGVSIMVKNIDSLKSEKMILDQKNKDLLLILPSNIDQAMMIMTSLSQLHLNLKAGNKKIYVLEQYLNNPEQKRLLYDGVNISPSVAQELTGIVGNGNIKFI